MSIFDSGFLEIDDTASKKDAQFSLLLQSFNLFHVVISWAENDSLRLGCGDRGTGRFLDEKRLDDRGLNRK